MATSQNLHEDSYSSSGIGSLGPSSVQPIHSQQSAMNFGGINSTTRSPGEAKPSGLTAAGMKPNKQRYKGMSNVNSVWYITTHCVHIIFDWHCTMSAKLSTKWRFKGQLQLKVSNCYIHVITCVFIYHINELLWTYIAGENNESKLWMWHYFINIDLYMSLLVKI